MLRLLCSDSGVWRPGRRREAEDATGPKADVFSAGVVMVELSSGAPPRPGPELRREGRIRVSVPEEERRAADLAAVRCGAFRVSLGVL